MNHVLIFAGGTGVRMNTTDKPKQFLELHGKPVIIYTIEHFEKHPEIDNILVVCLESYIEELWQLLNLYGIKKVSQIVPGGDGGDKSIYNGLKALESVCRDDDILLLHDGVRPLINRRLISENIDSVRKFGNAISIAPTSESIVHNSPNEVSVPPRNEMFSVKAPQAFRFSDIWDLHKRAHKDGIRTIDSAHLCSVYGVKMHFVVSSPYNIKITMPQDYFMFRALFEAMENKQLKELDEVF
jgi:2-C-methyl-D-erythritol 4-phosphate cytidylyltransferase